MRELTAEIIIQGSREIPDEVYRLAADLPAGTQITITDYEKDITYFVGVTEGRNAD